MSKKFTLDDFQKDRISAGEKINNPSPKAPRNKLTKDGIKASPQDAKPPSLHDGATSRRHGVSKEIKKLTIRLDTTIYNAWLKYEMENKVQGINISFQGLIEQYLTRKLKDYIK